MSYADRNVWVYKSKQAIEEFGARNITFPRPVTDAIDTMNRVAAAKPAKPDHTAIRHAIIAGAAQDEINALLVQDATHTRWASEHQQAHVDTAGAVLAAIRESEPHLLPALRKQAEACIDKLAQIAKLGGVKLEHLVRAGRQSDASLLAEKASIAAELTALYELRDGFLVRGGGKALTVNGIRCAVWRDPDAAAEHARGTSTADQYINGLTHGVPLWFPSGAEAVAAAQAIADQRAAAAEKRRSREHGIGNLAAFG